MDSYLVASIGKITVLYRFGIFGCTLIINSYQFRYRKIVHYVCLVGLTVAIAIKGV